jgi:hypothetical protein
MKRSKWLITMTGLLGLVMTTLPAPADAAVVVRFTVTGGGSATQTQIGTQIGTGLNFISAFTTADYSLTLNTSNTNFPGGDTGSLFTSVSLTSFKTGLLSDLTVLAEVFDTVTNQRAEFDLPNGSPLFVTTTATPNATNYGGGGTVVGTTIVNNVGVTTNPALYANLLGKTNTASVNSGATYTLANEIVFSGLHGGFASLGGQVSSSVAVPEPSSMALTGLVALGLAGVGVRRRLRSRAN